MKGQFGADYISAEPQSTSELVFLAFGSCSAQCTGNIVTVGWGGSDVGRVVCIDPSINQPPGEQSITRQQLSSAQPPLAALEKEEEEGNGCCCLATGGSRVIS